MQRTFHTRYRSSSEEGACLQKCASHFSKIKHSLLKATLKADGDTDALNAIKRKYLKKYEITGRQYNAIRVEVLGLIKGTRELQKTQATDLQARIDAISIPPEERKGRKKYTETPFQRHHRHRRACSLKQKLENLKADMKDGRIHATFGSKDLFKARQHLIKSGYVTRDGKEDIKRWDKEWFDGRENQFFTLGSEGETGGNQSCTATIQDNEKLQLRVRLPKDSPDKYLILKDVHFNRGHEKVLAAIRSGVALSYRFLRDKKSWKIFVSFDLPEVPLVSIRDSGRVCVDINIDHLAVVDLNRHGNQVHRFNIPLVTYGKSSDQTEQIVGEAVKTLLAYAVKVQKPIAIEDLDFQRKKAALQGSSPKHARMLSSFAYSMIINTVNARAFDFGIEVVSVNPAYTSLIGKTLFQRLYGMSGHQGAAMAIGRRSMKFRERIPPSLQVPLLTTSGDRKRHDWRQWVAYAKRKVPVAPALSLGKPTRGSSRKGTPNEEFGSMDAEQANEWAQVLLTSVQNGLGHDVLSKEEQV